MKLDSISPRTEPWLDLPTGGGGFLEDQGGVLSDHAITSLPPHSYPLHENLALVVFLCKGRDVMTIAHRVLARYLVGAKTPPEPKRYETREVLGGAYKGKTLGKRELLSHAVEIDDSGREVAVLCRGVKLDHIADPYASEEPLDSIPTCPRCAERLAKLKAKGLAIHKAR